VDGRPVRVGAAPLWQPLLSRLEKLADVRGATADWLSAGFDR